MSTSGRDPESIVGEIRANLERLESHLPKQVDGWALSQLSKLPFKAILYREALAWRMAELSRAALEEFEKGKLVAGITLTRAAVETSAALSFLCAKLEESVASAKVGDVDEYLMKLSMGIATNPPIDADTGDPATPRPIDQNRQVSRQRGEGDSRFQPSVRIAK